MMIKLFYTKIKHSSSKNKIINRGISQFTREKIFATLLPGKDPVYRELLSINKQMTDNTNKWARNLTLDSKGTHINT